MWPGYEAKMRRSLIKAGEPQGYKPEDIMALQEVGFVVGLLVGLILANGARLEPGLVAGRSRCSACSTR